MIQRIIVYFLILLAVATGAEIEWRVATRDDVDDSKYQDLGNAYDAVGSLRVGNRGCSGTLVTTTDGTVKVLTGAHCVDWDSDNVPNVSPSSVTLRTGVNLEGPSAVAVDIAVQSWDAIAAMDIAVITFGEFDSAPAPIPLTVSNARPIGEEVLLVGYGTHGSGLPPFDNFPDNLRRAAINVADEVIEDGENAGQIRTDFDHPRDPAFSTMGDAVPLALEGTSGSGDSGGPMIHDGKVVGVLHGGINPTEYGFSEYGDVSIFAGVFYPPNEVFLRANNVLVVGSSDPANSVSVDSIAQPGQPFVAASDGSPVSQGSVVRIGTLPREFDVAAADLTSVARAWLPFGETEVQAIAGQPGRFSVSNAADGTSFAGAKIYWWILESVAGPPAPDLGNVTGWGVFSSSGTNWRFPTPGLPPPANATLLTSAEVDEAAKGQLDSESLVLAPEFGTTVTYETWAENAFPDELQIPLDERAKDADPDGDRFSNGLEWILRTSPVVHNRQSPVRIAKAADGLAIRYHRQRFLPPGTDRIEFSRNLASLTDWIPAQANTTIIRILDRETEQVELFFAPAGAEGFWRLTFNSDE